MMAEIANIGDFNSEREEGGQTDEEGGYTEQD